MAMRFKFRQAFEALPLDDDNLTRPTVSRPPALVEFRNGVDMAELVAEVDEHRSVLLDAAVGSGKTIRFPPAFAAATGALVMHVVPNPLLAVDTYGYVVKVAERSGRGSVPLERWCSAEQQVPRTGVLYMSSNDLVQLCERERNSGMLAQYPGLTVYLDESHESDACTFLLRHLGLNLGMARLIQASATFGPTDFRQRETIGTVQHGSYVGGTDPTRWDLDDMSKPWHFGRIVNHLLVYTDSRKAAAHLVGAYGDAGFLAYNLYANMPEEDFQAAMRALRDKTGPLVVLVADYAFRSGFTFDIGTVVDTGMVSYFDPTPGVVRKLFRPACQFELYQASGRVGRVVKGMCRYYDAGGSYPPEICDVEGVEREAAAYLCRCLGFKPLGLLSATVMSRERLPTAVSSSNALASVYPLTYYVMGADGGLRPTTPDLVDGEAVKAPGSRRDSGLSGLGDAVVEERPKSPRYLTDADYLEFVQSLGSDSVLPELGSYVRAVGVAANEPATGVTFPNGLRSVCVVMDSFGPGLPFGAFSVDERKYATSLVVNRYNALNVEISALDGAMRQLAANRCVSGHGTRERVVKGFEDRAVYLKERVRLHDYLDRLTRGHCDVRVMDAMVALESRRAQYYYEQFVGPDDVPDGGYEEDLARQVEDERSEYNSLDYAHHRHRRHRRIRYRASDGSTMSLPASAYDVRPNVESSVRGGTVVWKVTR